MLILRKTKKFFLSLLGIIIQIFLLNYRENFKKNLKLLLIHNVFKDIKKTSHP